MIEIIVPTLGESVTEATVATWFKKIGDYVETDEMICELETDKVAIEVPSTVTGILTEIVAQEGSVVALDGVLAKISSEVSAKTNNKAVDEVGMNTNISDNIPENKVS